MIVGVRSKTITQGQITGERGQALAKARAHEMGFLYSPYGPVEAGIDGLIEIRDRITGQVDGRMVAVQVKTTDHERYTAETDVGFEYLCQPEDVAYWQRCSLPVIVVLVRVSDATLFWKQAPIEGSPNDPDVRRLTINKATDRFDKLAADAITALAVDQAKPGIWLPPSPETDTLLLNAVKVALPETIQVAATTYRHGRDALRALLDLSDHPPAEWVAKARRLITFLDIESSLLRQIVDRGSIETFPVSQFSLEDDEEEQRLFVELLNRTLRAQLDPLLNWSRPLRLYYFPPQGRRIDLRYAYRSLRKDTSRAVVMAKRRNDGSISYVRHSAFSGRFWREFDDWYLTIEPNYVFTRDGFLFDRFAGERVSKLKRRERNSALCGQFVMWRSLLTGLGAAPQQCDLLTLPRPPSILRFAALDALTLPLSVPDEVWRSRDADPPTDDDDEENLLL
jgi:Domain of unknown function (DUF4365)